MTKRVLFFTALGAVLLWGGIMLLGTDTKAPPRVAVALSVTVVKAQLGNIAETISATGVTVPREEIQVMSELSGVRVRNVLVDVGDSVKKGQELAALDGASLANLLVQLRSEYERTRDAFARVNAIKDTGAVSKQSVFEKRTAMQAAKALSDNAELDLKRSTILAPDDGVIFERNAVIGGLISDSKPLFRIARHHEIELEAMVPESALFALRQGLSVSVTLAGRNIPIEGTIRLITPRVDSATRMAAIRVHLQSANPIPIGLFATARIMQSEHKGMLLSKTAIQRDSIGDFVWVLSAEDKAERRSVKVTVFGDEQVMVDAIPPDARVIARAGAFIKQGDLVRVTRDE